MYMRTQRVLAVGVSAKIICCVDTAISRVIANYKLAVPSYYNSKIQLMIPLCFTNNDIPDVALVLDEQEDHCYQAVTCLTMEMAYMDARLIARPESNWLMAEHIQGTDQLEDLSDQIEETIE